MTAHLKSARAPTSWPDTVPGREPLHRSVSMYLIGPAFRCAGQNSEQGLQGGLRQSEVSTLHLGVGHGVFSCFKGWHALCKLCSSWGYDTSACFKWWEGSECWKAVSHVRLVVNGSLMIIGRSPAAEPARHGLAVALLHIPLKPVVSCRLECSSCQLASSGSLCGDAFRTLQPAGHRLCLPVYAGAARGSSRRGLQVSKSGHVS